jgi:hypothetical protein
VNPLASHFFDAAEDNATLFVPNFLTPEGREEYSSMFRDAILQRNEEWLAADLLKRGLVAASEAPARAEGAAARPVLPRPSKRSFGESTTGCIAALCVV